MLRNLLTIGIVCLLVERSFQQSFEEDCVSAHNKYRRLHIDTPDVEGDSYISSYAQEWADRLANDNDFNHRPDNEFGENLYAIWGHTDIGCDQVVDTWYNEIKQYDYNNPGFGMNTGHFTQVIWKNTKRIGCAIAKKISSAIVVCNYDPYGNLMGAFEENVMRAK